MSKTEIPEHTRDLYMRFTDQSKRDPEYRDIYVSQGRLCATNGKVAIRSASDDWPSDDKNFTLPIHKLFVNAQSNPIVTIPEIAMEPPRAMIKCFECKGVGSFNICTDCDGCGEIECRECGHTHRCSECNGVGNFLSPKGIPMPCDACGGEGKKPVVNVVKVGEYWYDYDLLKLTLGGEFERWYQSGEKMLYAVGPEHEAVMMPRFFSIGEQGVYWSEAEDGWVVSGDGVSIDEPETPTPRHRREG